MMRLVLLVFLFILSAGPACSPLVPDGATRLPATGIDGAWSRQVVVADDGHILPSRADFDAALRSGLSATLISPDTEARPRMPLQGLWP